MHTCNTQMLHALCMHSAQNCSISTYPYTNHSMKVGCILLVKQSIVIFILWSYYSHRNLIHIILLYSCWKWKDWQFFTWCKYPNWGSLLYLGWVLAVWKLILFQKLTHQCSTTHQLTWKIQIQSLMIFLGMSFIPIVMYSILW